MISCLPPCLQCFWTLGDLQPVAILVLNVVVLAQTAIMMGHDGCGWSGKNFEEYSSILSCVTLLLWWCASPPPSSSLSTKEEEEDGGIVFSCEARTWHITYHHVACTCTCRSQFSNLGSICQNMGIKPKNYLHVSTTTLIQAMIKLMIYNIAVGTVFVP